MFQGGFERGKRPGAAQNDRRLSEGLGEVIGEGMAGSRNFFSNFQIYDVGRSWVYFPGRSTTEAC